MSTLTPKWNIESEYLSVDSSEFSNDFNEAKKIVSEIKLLAAKDLNVTTIQKCLRMHDNAYVLLINLSRYSQCKCSVEAKDELANQSLMKISLLISELIQIMIPIDLEIQTCSLDKFNQIISPDDINLKKFSFELLRKEAPYMLSKQEEILLESLSIDGHSNWSDLHDKIHATTKVKINHPDYPDAIGLSMANSLLRQSNSEIRKEAWYAIQDAWKIHAESACAIINSLSGWRHTINKKRSHTLPVDHLDEPCRTNRIKKDTLFALMNALEKNSEKLRQGSLVMAKLLNKPKLDPWDLLAPGPQASNQSESMDFENAILLIRDAFAEIHPEMGDFVDLCKKNNWIEGRVLPNKSGGAYCTGFAKSRTPRVFMTYMGSANDIITLAHELGHAFHSWIMRDMPLSLTNYPMTLAETASVFGESALIDRLLNTTTNIQDKIKVAWGELERSQGYLVNIPARFDFENAFYEERKVKIFSIEELCSLMDKSLAKWYGDTVTKNDPYFWASKGHFHISGKWSFYNFPYAFGFLFSLSIYGRQEQLGKDFFPTYVSLLRDTGRMTSEELVLKHLREDITQPKFWQKAIDVVVSKINTYNKLADELASNKAQSYHSP